MKNIAIIGGGAAGCAAAWALQHKYNVILFESSSYLGGHAYSHHVDANDKSIAIDMGVEYFHERISPNLVALFEKLDISTYIAPMSFKAFDDDAEHSNYYWSNADIAGHIKANLHDEMNRFQQDMLRIMQQAPEQYKAMSVQEFLDKNNYSQSFRTQALLPLLTTFSGCKAPSLDYSLPYVAMSFNLNLLSFFSPCHWRKITGGVGSLYDKLQDKMKVEINLNTTITSVTPNGKTVRLCTQDNQTLEVDTLIFACPANRALEILKNTGEKQQELLGAFQYIPVTSALHQDKNAVSSKSMSKEYFQFKLDNKLRHQQTGYLTRVNHNLAPYQESSTPLFVSFDNDNINNDKMIHKKSWQLPMLRPIDMLRKTRLHEIQGVDNLWFCGADCSLTGHEGAFVSGLVIAHRLGARYPFEKNFLAKVQFDIIKGFMGVYLPIEKVNDKFTSALMNISKKLNLHKRLSSKFVREVMF